MASLDTRKKDQGHPDENSNLNGGSETMCPKFDNGICSVAGIEPEYLECADGGCCYEGSYEYETCRLYMVDCIVNCREAVEKAA